MPRHVKLLERAAGRAPGWSVEEEDVFIRIIVNHQREVRGVIVLSRGKSLRREGFIVVDVRVFLAELIELFAGLH